MESLQLKAVARVSNWQPLLADYIVDVARQRFQYGLFDCGLFVANCIEVMTGTDVAHAMRGAYHTRREAFEMARLLSGQKSVATLADGIAAAYGISEVPVAYAQRGDVVQLHRGRAASLGIVAPWQNPPELLTPFSRGLLRLPVSLAVRAWRI